MTWENDEEAMDAFDRLVINCYPDLNRFMSIVHEKQLIGENPAELMVRIIANFFSRYVIQRDIHPPEDALTMTKAIMMNDPVLHHLVQMNVGQKVEEVLDDE